MAVFFHDNRSIAYKIDPAPFAHDLLLLQNSSFSAAFWAHVTRELGQPTGAGGRIITCEWHEPTLDTDKMSHDLLALIHTLGLQELRVVACGDAVQVAETIQRDEPGTFAKTLYYRDDSVPKTDAISAALQI